MSNFEGPFKAEEIDIIENNKMYMKEIFDAVIEDKTMLYIPKSTVASGSGWWRESRKGYLDFNINYYKVAGSEGKLMDPMELIRNLLDAEKALFVHVGQEPQFGAYIYHANHFWNVFEGELTISKNKDALIAYLYNNTYCDREGFVEKECNENDIDVFEIISDRYDRYDRVYRGELLTGVEINWVHAQSVSTTFLNNKNEVNL